jgi:hypothetical protein
MPFYKSFFWFEMRKYYFIVFIGTMHDQFYGEAAQIASCLQ